MWVEVTDVSEDRLLGMLVNTPLTTPGLDRGDDVEFNRDHVLDIVTDPDPALSEAARWEARAPVPMLLRGKKQQRRRPLAHLTKDPPPGLFRAPG